MYDLTTKRVRFTSEADITLKMMKARTGLTPNILCRLALALSLDEPGLPRLVTNDEKSSREINRFTLLGEYDAAFVALTKVRLHSDQVHPSETDEIFLAHIHRGLQLLPNRVRSIGDMASLCHGP